MGRGPIYQQQVISNQKGYSIILYLNLSQNWVYVLYVSFFCKIYRGPMNGKMVVFSLGAFYYL